jgi:hypothetical protein
MRITWDELTVNFQTHDEKDLLEDWRWFLGDSVHFSILGQIHRQVIDLPPGTRISDIKLKGT